MIDCGIGKWGVWRGEAPHMLMTNKPIFRGHGPKSFSAYGPKNLNPALTTGTERRTETIVPVLGP